jgi:hypothetical protein
MHVTTTPTQRVVLDVVMAAEQRTRWLNCYQANLLLGDGQALRTLARPTRSRRSCLPASRSKP